MRRNLTKKELRQRREARAAEKRDNESMAPEFREMVRRYGVIMPPHVTTIAVAQQELAEASGPGAPPDDRAGALLGLAAAYIKHGQVADGLAVLQDVRTIHLPVVQEHEALKMWVRHLHLKAKAAQGQLPIRHATIDLLPPQQPVDYDYPAWMLCLCDLTYRAGKPEWAMQAAEFVVGGAHLVYRLVGNPQTPEDIKLNQMIGGRMVDFGISVWNMAVEAMKMTEYVPTYTTAPLP